MGICLAWEKQMETEKPNDVLIRRATLEDASLIAATIKVANTTDQIREQIEMMTPQMQAGTLDHLVAVDKNRIVGNVVVMPTRHWPPAPHRAEMADFVVALSHRGTGLARRLLRAAIERAREMGYVQIETSGIDERAELIYEHLGFLRYGVLPNAVKQQDGTYRDVALLFLDLEEAARTRLDEKNH
jgi:predicted N-acetyltransferase YhbS